MCGEGRKGAVIDILCCSIGTYWAIFTDPLMHITKRAAKCGYLCPHQDRVWHMAFFYSRSRAWAEAQIRGGYKNTLAPSCVTMLSRYFIMAFLSWLSYVFLGSLYNTLCAHVVFERFTDREWHNSSGTIGRGGSLEQVARVLATQRQEKLFVSN